MLWVDDADSFFAFLFHIVQWIPHQHQHIQRWMYIHGCCRKEVGKKKDAAVILKFMAYAGRKQGPSAFYEYHKLFVTNYKL